MQRRELPFYMPPELACGKDYDLCGDVWALVSAGRHLTLLHTERWWARLYVLTLCAGVRASRNIASTSPLSGQGFYT